MTLPSGAKGIPDLWTFKKRVGPCSHIAVYRPLLKIYHHYLVKQLNINSIVIIHNVEGLSKSTPSGFYHIQEDEIEFTTKPPYLNKFESDHLDLKSGVYLIERPGYPITTFEKEKVIERATKQLVEKDYTFSSSNCEWFVILALTEVGECGQMEVEREVSKKVVGFLPAVGGSVWGALIGHVLIPVPVVGGIVGGVVGGLIGSRTHGTLHDRQREELRKQAIIQMATEIQYNGQGEAL
ncbi:unnamed protein product [Mytilus coruscus]|uniref:LRAT domain-containing protein n=1 Tax=Mytilus coruscus TaxID=42192 RepID=A0A6J8F1F7_MYTCO|nr:unnamed protein product [Mytilus coruscus]